MAGKYSSFEELALAERYGHDYRVRYTERVSSSVLILAPHGGSIEIGTSELAVAICGEEHNLFIFEGLKPYGENRQLHITSRLFEHPQCLAIARRCHISLAIHGCKGEAQACIGGLDAQLGALLAVHLRKAGIDVLTQGHPYPGIHPTNICNRNQRNQGAQLELTRDLRTADARAVIAAAVRTAMSEHSISLRNL